MTEPKTTLYCVCKKASNKVCVDCPKLKKIKPDYRLNCSTWEREIKEFKQQK